MNISISEAEKILPGGKMSEALAEFYKHNLWANLRLIDFCAALNDEQLDATTPGTFGSVRNTLLHIIANEEHYIGLLTNQSPVAPLRQKEGFPGFESLREHALRSGDKLAQISTKVDPEQILRGEFRGEAYAIPVLIPLIQAINHATEHRAQVATILTQQCLQPPVLDGWTYDEEHQT
jgi:uncharacterized damage-inducible protein DinB